MLASQSVVFANRDSLMPVYLCKLKHLHDGDPWGNLR